MLQVWKIYKLQSGGPLEYVTKEGANVSSGPMGAISRVCEKKQSFQGSCVCLFVSVKNVFSPCGHPSKYSTNATLFAFLYCV